MLFDVGLEGLVSAKGHHSVKLNVDILHISYLVLKQLQEKGFFLNFQISDTEIEVQRN